MVNYVRTADGTWHRATCPDIRRPDIETEARSLPADPPTCDACLDDE